MRELFAQGLNAGCLLHDHSVEENFPFIGLCYVFQTGIHEQEQVQNQCNDLGSILRLIPLILLAIGGFLIFRPFGI